VKMKYKSNNLFDKRQIIYYYKKVNYFKKLLNY